MMIWAIFAAMTGAAVFALLWPLGHGRMQGFADVADARSLYRAQLKEIDRDLARRLIGEEEAQAARTEAARRLLRAAGDEAGPAGETEPSLRRRRASSALMLSVVPLLALVIYGLYGAPGQPDQPLAARLEKAGPQQDFAVMLARMEAHLAANPADARGWSLLAPIYLRQGRYDEAAKAFAAAVRFGKPDAELYAGLGEARIMEAGGVVTAAAREALAEAVSLDPKSPRARYYLALAKEQDGDGAGAEAALVELLAEAPADADWAGAVRGRLERMRGDAGGKAIAALPEAERQQAIRAMVDGLAERLNAGGGSLPEWSRLIRARTVLGDRAAALQAMKTARERLAGDEAALAALGALAQELALKEAAP
ncbi:c-type cytochrome biogenesis protein CcmI [Bosea sp. (in: a-proteobacteria)]|uniref:c-type cytochrome biogenesis protein CcmI n=1 Tax=Bosea sp. (in: a-proteobacteria) TaxID=1871050 RepID=UPI0026326416|nr:c-type cytochrome biogenesis protein CcmI [Bosea sp. (in: a-proteobacteria)]MCO5092561.1 c-type cytochrome biogenesis protein CcmI [Bosea sp. (in: a-proteobacteria)]